MLNIQSLAGTEKGKKLMYCNQKGFPFQDSTFLNESKKKLKDKNRWDQRR